MPKWLQLPSDKLLYQPHQQEFLKSRRLRICPKCKTKYETSPEKYNCCGVRGIRVYGRLTIIAGRRFGKSLIGSIASVEEACIPNSIVWCCAPTNPKLNRYVIPALQKLIPEDWVQSWSSEFNDLRLKNGSLIHFQTLEDPDQGRGQGLDALWIDEVCELTEEHWNVIEPSLGDKQGVAFFTTSPRSYDWVYNRLYKPAEDGYIVTPEGDHRRVSGFWALHARTIDNPIFQTSQGRAFLEQQEATMPRTMYQQEYNADFVVFTGSVYGSLISPQLLSDDEAVRKIIPEWPDIASWRQVLVGIDTGADHPFAAVKLVSTEYGIVAVAEYLERDKPYVVHANNLKMLAGTVDAKWALNKNERQGIWELAQHKIYCQRAENDVIAGTEHVKSLLFNRKLWIIESKCPRLVKQLKSYRYDDTARTDGQLGKQTVYKKDDDLCDALRYICMTTWVQNMQVTPPPTDKLRKLDEFPTEMQWAVQRIRRIEAEPKEPKDAFGDFYGFHDDAFGDY